MGYKRGTKMNFFAFQPGFHRTKVVKISFTVYVPYPSDLFKVFYSEPVEPLGKIPHLALIG